MRRIGIGVSILSFVAGCQGTPTTEGIRYTNRPIINGTLDTDPAHDAVVALTDDFGFAFCTGTYVGARTIVTAGHCFEGGAPTFVYFGFGGSVSADADAQACANNNQAACAHFFPVVDSQVNPGFSINTLLNDIAVIRIDQDPPGINPISPLTFKDGTQFVAADEGSPISFAGYGVENGFNQTGGGERIVVGDPFDPNSPTVLGAVGPDGGTGIDGNQVFYSQPVGGPCNGDSGGPLFIARGGQEFLGAVTSFGDQTCTDFGVSTRVDVFEDFICTFSNNQSLGCDGAIPPENCTNGADDDGDGAIDCADNACANDPACENNTGDGCQAVNNGVCDPDCAGREDPDCRFSQRVLGCTVSTPEDAELPVGLALLFAFAGLGLVLSRKK